MKKILLLTALISLSYFSAFASHLMGGEITYTHVGGDDYEVTLVIYRDCNGINLSTNQTVTFESASCGQDFDFDIPFIQFTDNSQVCPGQTTTCNGGTTPGTEAHTFRGVVTLPPCTDWIMHWNQGTRNQAIQNLVDPDLENIYIQNTLNNVIAPGNNSPQFFASPTPYLCANNLAIYSHAAADPDGDSLYYSFNQPLGTPGPPGTPIAFMPGYSLNDPLTTTAGINFDQTTGEMCFTPDQGQIVVISVLVEEFRNGLLVGTQIREMQVVVDPNCTNTNPTTGVAASCGGAASLNLTVAGPSVIQTDPNSVLMCPNDNVCFEVNFSDPDGDNITISSPNVAIAMPGATFTIVGNGTPNPVGTFCWTPTPLDSGLNVFAIIAEDDACPIIGTQTFVFDVTVFDEPFAGLDDTICGNQEAQLTAQGGAGYVWSVITGDPIVVGTNFSCTNCYNPLASPSVTTTYLLTSTLAAACNNTDTVTVVVVPSFTVTTAQSDTNVCLAETVSFDVTQDIPGAYTYTWGQPGILDNTTISNPTGLFNNPGSFDLDVTVNLGNGCIVSDTVTVNVAPAVVPDVNILTPDSLIECGDSVLIDLDLGGGIPAGCGASVSNSCSGPTSLATLGTNSGANTSTTWPAPYGNWYRNAKHQFLFTAAELNTMGFSGGKITEIAWEVTQINGTTTYNDYQIKMGCTSTSNLTTWENGLTPVFGSPIATHNINIVAGWNTHTLDVAYEWDGISNLVVEICYDNLGSTWTNNSITPWTTTAFTSSIWYRSDATAACPTTLNTGTGNDRPITRFTHCPTVPDPAAFTYNWLPNVEVTTANIQNPYLHPTVPTTYSVIVSDITGSCSDTSSIDITVQCPTCDQPGITLINPTCKDGTDGKIIVTPTFQLGSEQHTYTYSDSVTTTVLQTTPNVVAGMLDSIINIGAGAYTISLLDTNGCTKDTTVWLTEPDSVIITSTSLDQIVCIDGTAQVEATASSFNGGPFTYTWTDLLTNTVVPVSLPQNVTPTASPTTYSVFATDVLGCISKADSTVTVTHLPPLDASTTLLNAETTICQNTAVDINMSATGGSGTGYHYEWFTNNVSIGTGDVINVNPNASPTEYIGVAHDDCTTPADSITITVYWTGEIFPSIVKDREDSCFTDIPVMFTNTSTPSALIQTTEWTTSNGNSGTGNTFSSEFNGPGCFDVSLKMTTILGCEVDTTFPCFVNPHGYPDANFDMTPPITDLLNTEIDFNNLSTGTGPLSYVWDFNSGVLPDSTTEENPIYTFRDDSAGIYSVTLTVTDTNGCVDIAKGNVVINNTYLFYIPSSFTPNGDGLNDDFKAYGEGIELSNYTMSIFNRWGELMFQTNNLSNGWDGTYKGKPVKAGVYIWKIKAKEEAGTVIHKNHGQITIAR